jgi:hypothetical protein
MVAFLKYILIIVSFLNCSRYSGLLTVNGFGYTVNDVYFDIDTPYNISEINTRVGLMNDIGRVTFNTCEQKYHPNIVLHCIDGFTKNEMEMASNQIQTCADIKDKCFDMTCNTDKYRGNNDCDTGDVLNAYTKINHFKIRCASYSYPTNPLSDFSKCNIEYQMNPYYNYYYLSNVFGGTLLVPLFLTCFSLTAYTNNCIEGWSLLLSFATTVIINWVILCPIAIKILSTNTSGEQGSFNFLTWLILLLICEIMFFTLAFVLKKFFECCFISAKERYDAENRELEKKQRKEKKDLKEKQELEEQLRSEKLAKELEEQNKKNNVEIIRMQCRQELAEVAERTKKQIEQINNDWLLSKEKSLQDQIKLQREEIDELRNKLKSTEKDTYGEEREDDIELMNVNTSSQSRYDNV